jgi:hypothetical protein
MLAGGRFGNQDLAALDRPLEDHLGCPCAARQGFKTGEAG